MKTTLGAVISSLAGMIRLANTEKDFLKDAYRETDTELPIIKASTFDSDEFKSEPTPCQNAYRAFMDALPMTFVVSLYLLYMDGQQRHRGSIVEKSTIEHWTSFRTNILRESMLFAIASKANAMDYITESAINLPVHVDLLPELLNNAVITG